MPVSILALSKCSAVLPCNISLKKRKKIRGKRNKRGIEEKKEEKKEERRKEIQKKR